MVNYREILRLNSLKYTQTDISISLKTSLNILDARNHNSGKLETDIPDVGNRLNSA